LKAINNTGYQLQIVDKFKEKSQIKTNKTYISEKFGVIKCIWFTEKAPIADLQYKNNF